MSSILSSSLATFQRGFKAAADFANRHPTAARIGIAAGVAAAGALIYTGYQAVDACFYPPKHCYHAESWRIFHDQPSIAGSEYLGSFFYDKVERRELIPGGTFVCQWRPTICEKGWDEIGQLGWEIVRNQGKKAAAACSGALISLGTIEAVSLLKGVPKLLFR